MIVLESLNFYYLYFVHTASLIDSANIFYIYIYALPNGMEWNIAAQNHTQIHLRILQAKSLLKEPLEPIFNKFNETETFYGQITKSYGK